MTSCLHGSSHVIELAIQKLAEDTPDPHLPLKQNCRQVIPPPFHHIRCTVLSASNDTICRPEFPLGRITTASWFETRVTSSGGLLISVAALCHDDTVSARASRLPVLVHSNHTHPPDLLWKTIPPLVLPKPQLCFVSDDDSGIVINLSSLAESSTIHPPWADVPETTCSLWRWAASSGSSSRYIVF